MLTPDGQPANEFEKVMLLAIWANYIAKQDTGAPQTQFIFAGLGKPTYPIHKHTINYFKNYWHKLEKDSENWQENSDCNTNIPAIDYGSPYGEHEARELMAVAMSKWYTTTILPENVFFTVGGIGALSLIFQVLNDLHAQDKKYRVITPYPYYSAYANNDRHILHPIDVMHEPGYQLTAKSLQKSIDNAYLKSKLDGIKPKAVLICNPSNPLGSIIPEDELLKIANVLDDYPELLIIFDEAYAEINFVDIPSFLQVAPNLKHRTCILRSATKALSAAGERMAILLCFNKPFLSKIVQKAISNFVHAPRSGQMAYAETMFNLTPQDRYNISAYYKAKVDYVIQRIDQMGAAMDDQSYQVQGTFYAIADFSDMIDINLPEEVQKIVGRHPKVTGGEDIAYLFMIVDSLMITPLSYFGLGENCSYLRITCCAAQEQLITIMNRIEHRLKQARLEKINALQEKINMLPAKLSSAEIIDCAIEDNLNDFSCKELRNIISKLESILTSNKLLYQNYHPFAVAQML